MNGKDLVSKGFSILPKPLPGTRFMPEDHELTQIKFERFCKRLFGILFLIYIPLVLCGVSLILQFSNWASGSGSLNETSLQRFLRELEIFILFCFSAVGLHSIRTVRKPFTQTMAVCLFAAGILVLLFSVLIPTLFPTLKSGYDLFRFGRFSMDGLSAAPGVLLLLFGRIYHYGVKLQNADDLTI